MGLPVARGYPQPLAAAYRTALAPVAGRLVAEQRLRPAFLFEQCQVTRLDEAALREDPVLAALDPDLDSVVNVNEPGDYAEARARPAPEVTIQRFGTLADGHRGPRPVRAATVAGAAAAAGMTLDGHVVAALNGDQITRDGQTPLVTGDIVFFLAADARRLTLMTAGGYFGRALVVDAGDAAATDAAAARRGAAGLHRRRWARRLADARARPARRGPAGRRGAAGLRVLPAGRARR